MRKGTLVNTKRGTLVKKLFFTGGGYVNFIYDQQSYCTHVQALAVECTSAGKYKSSFYYLVVCWVNQHLKDVINHVPFFFGENSVCDAFM